MLFAEPVLGFRSWRVNVNTGGLQGKVIPVRWEHDGPTEAICKPTFGHFLSGYHESPNFDCMCGLYAYHSVEFYRERPEPMIQSVFGAVIAWGDICVYTKGFKAQYARPICLVNRRDERDLKFNLILRQVAEIYKIPLMVEKDLEEYANTFGRPLDPSLL